VPVPSLTHLEATVIQVTPAGKPMLIFATYPFAFPPTDRSSPERLFRRGIAGLLPGDLKFKHVAWNSRLNTRRGKHLHDYADENSCLILSVRFYTNPGNN